MAQAESGNQYKHEALAGFCDFGEGPAFLAQGIGLFFGQADFAVAEFDLEYIDHLVVAVEQQVNLRAFLSGCAFFVKRGGERVYSADTQGFFYLGDMFEANTFKCVAAPGFVFLGLAEVLPGTAAFMDFIFDKLQIKKRILIGQAVKHVLFPFSERIVPGDKAGLFQFFQYTRGMAVFRNFSQLNDGLTSHPLVARCQGADNGRMFFRVLKQRRKHQSELVPQQPSW